MREARFFTFSLAQRCAEFPASLCEHLEAATRPYQSTAGPSRSDRNLSPSVNVRHVPKRAASLKANAVSLGGRLSRELKQRAARSRAPRVAIPLARLRRRMEDSRRSL